MYQIIFGIIFVIFGLSVYVFIKDNQKKSITPSLYGWVILLVASLLAMASFFTANGLSYSSVIAGVMFLANVFGLIFIIGYLLYKDDKNLSVNWLDIFSFVSSIVIVVFWYFSNDAYTANLLIQALMVFGYIVHINNIYKHKKAVDSFLFWILSLATCLLSFITSYGEGSELAIINSWRSSVSVIVLLLFMWYYRQKEQVLLKRL